MWGLQREWGLCGDFYISSLGVVNILRNFRGVVGSRDLDPSVVAPSLRIFFGYFCIENSFGLLQGSKGFSLENPRKESEKGFPGPLGPGAEKVRKRVENEPKTRKKVEKLSFFDSFSSFFDPGAGRPREPLFRLFSGVF